MAVQGARHQADAVGAKFEAGFRWMSSGTAKPSAAAVSAAIAD